MGVVCKAIERFARDFEPSQNSLKLSLIQIVSEVTSALAGADKVPLDTELLPDDGKKVWSVHGYKPFFKALFTNSSASMVYDWDDYIFAGHTGHSAVFTALATAELFGIDDDRKVLEAVAFGNEIGARLGVLALEGPLNGQMMSFLHSAISSSVFLYLSERREDIPKAIASALAHPLMPTVRGFMGSGCKLLVASLPTVLGIFVASSRPLASGEEIDGFFSEYSWRKPPEDFVEKVFDPSCEFTRTLAFKPYPGCAYVQSAIDCALFIKQKIIGTFGEFNPNLVDEIEVRVSAVEWGMDRMNRKFSSEKTELERIVKANFSTALSVALALLSDRPNQRMFERWEEAKALARKVRIRLDPDHTRRLLEGITVRPRPSAKIPLSALERLKFLDLVPALSEIFALAPIFAKARKFLKERFDLNLFAFNFGATVRVRYLGRTFEEERQTHAGACGDVEDKRKVVLRKIELSDVNLEKIESFFVLSKFRILKEPT